MKSRIEEYKKERNTLYNMFLVEAKDTEQKLEKLLKDSGFELDCSFEGDTQGIQEEKLYISKSIKGKYNHYFEYTIKSY